MSIESWARWAEIERGLAPRTVAGYRRQLQRLGPEIDQFSTAELREVLYAEGGLASTVANRLAAWRSYFRFLVRSGVRQDDPTSRLDRPRVKRGLPKPVRDFERRAAILDPEFRWIAVLLFETGMRVSELKAFEVTDGALYVRGKGSKERWIPLSTRALRALEALDYEVRPSVRTIERRFQDVGMWPHALRHSFATRIIASGGDIGDVKELLGHASVATSQVYAAYDRDRLRRALERASGSTQPLTGDTSAPPSTEV